MSLYQKYRGKTFEEVLAQEHVTQVLKTSIQNQTFGHAYLFVGTRGTGKTSLARIFARAINCKDIEYVKTNGEPCNKCESCIQSLEGNNIDIIELDAASNRGIDEVRNLIESVDFLPSMGSYKVYIIDEVHMMTKEAFNALLKTIEEPPKHVVFILCTTEINKVPPTIISRSQLFELKHAREEQLVNKITKILKQEGKDIDDEGKKLIAKLGKGSFRDTESILEKVLISSTTDKIDYDYVVSILGLSSILFINNIKNNIYLKDLKAVQEALQNDLDEGKIINFNYQLAESIYEDIIKDLENNTVDSFKTELFDFLTSIYKDLRNTTSPRLLYIAKVLNFLKNFSNYNVTSLQPSVSAPVKTETMSISQEATNTIAKEDTVEQQKSFSNNPSAMLRAAVSRMKRTEAENPSSIEKPAQEKPKLLSKIDFLDYLKEKNLFLYRLFLHNEFDIKDNTMTVDVKTRMQKDLLSRPANLNILKAFGEAKGVELLVDFGEVKTDKRTKEEKEIHAVQKKVEDLSDEEIAEIFKQS